jgi:hypothetical protein
VQLKTSITKGATITPSATIEAHVMSQGTLNSITTIAKCQQVQHQEQHQT